MRVVVVGHGMVGSRFVEELTRRAESITGGDLAVTVIGTEEYEPYNRVLLSEVVAGAADVASLTLPRSTTEGVTVLPGVTARSIDRASRTVRTAGGEVLGYDVLVLATGARARIPQLAGLDAGAGPVADLPAGVHALRTLDDAREIVAASVNARRTVVLGGGVLGLEVACGLRRRGLAVTVVHGGGHPMDRQLDPDAGAAVLHGLDRLGIGYRTGARAEAVLVEDGRARGLRLRGDHEGPEDLAADLLVLTVGTVPETGLAGTAGLAVSHGVVVDADGSTGDPAIYAIGDCAEPPEGGTGLIAQGWDQARRLAAHLVDRLRARAAVGPPTERAESHLRTATSTCDLPARPVAASATHGTDVVRLKAHGLEVVTMGVGSAPAASAGRRSVRLSDPSAGRHVEVTVAGGVVVSATCIGGGRVAAELTTAYTRRTPAPADPAQLLLSPVPGAATRAADPSPTLMPDRATVCRCNGVTKGDLVACWRHGARSVEDVARSTRATTGCGGCVDAVCGIVDWLRRSDVQPEERTPAAGPPVPRPSIDSVAT